MFESGERQQAYDFDGKDGEAQQGHTGKQVDDFAIGFEAFAQPDEDWHPDDNDVEQCLKAEFAWKSLWIIGAGSEQYNAVEIIRDGFFKPVSAVYGVALS